MKWTEGHVWVSEKPLITTQPFFRYSYLMMNLDSTTKIDNKETGVSRIADLASIGSHGDQYHGRNDDTETIGYYLNSHGATKHIEIHDIWRCIKVKFTVLHSRLEDDQSIRITGSIPELGNWNRINPIQLRPSIHQYNV